jgi:hypothetical protein
VSIAVDLAAAVWTRSSYSDANGGECVEFSREFIGTHEVIPIRDSKAPQGATLIVPITGWSTFVSAVRRGELA